jgi:hypothetical protein
MTIDGKLDEWDLSGTITCTKDVDNLLDLESCKVAAMWDQLGVYLSFRFRDTTPMCNNIDPVTMPGNGWRSDCVQLRCNMDGFVSHIDAWYYTDGKKPAMHIHYGSYRKNAQKPTVARPANPVELGARQAFSRTDDGKGYVQEMMLPWAVLTHDGRAPAADADLRVGLELFWGNRVSIGGMTSRLTDNFSEKAKTADFFWSSEQNWGRLIREATNDLALPPPAWERNVRAEPRGIVPITFSVPKESYVTLAIEDAVGNRVRSLIGGVKFSKGEHTVMWDGLNDRNELLPNGDYRWLGINRDTIDIHWLMSFYQPNPHTPWNTADGKGGWGSDHGCMEGIAAGKGLVFLAGLGAEAGNGLFAINEKGKKRWTVKDAGADLLAYADGTLYAYRAAKAWNPLGLADTGIMRFDAKTGKWFNIQTPGGKLVKRLNLLPPEESNVKKSKHSGPSGDSKTRVISGFAANTAGVYISVPGKDVVRAFDRETFQLKRSYPLAGASTLFAPNAECLLVATPTGLKRLNLSDGKTTVLVAGDVAAATAITANRKRIWVAFGEPSPQVRVFSAKAISKDSGQASLLRIVGKPEGCTRNGFYDPNEGFYNPSGIAVDSKGRLWVAEDNMRPKRTSVWKDGRWQREFIGDTYYGGGGMINPLDPTMAFYNNMRFKIDLKKQTWQLAEVGCVSPEAHGRLDDDAANLLGRANSPASSRDYAVACQGNLYLTSDLRSPKNSSGSRTQVRRIARLRADGRTAVCVLIAPKEKIAWIDLNDDCLAQPEEFFRGGQQDNWGQISYWGQRPSQNLDLFFACGHSRHSPETPGLRLRLQRVTPGGTPVYDFNRFETMAGECRNGIGLKDGSYNSGSAGDRGEYFSEMRRIRPVGDTRRTFWFRGQNTKRWTPRLPEPGVVLYPFQAHGVADAPSIGGEIVCWVSDFGERYLFTDDMLYVDQLFKDGRVPYQEWPAKPKRGFRANEMSPGQESFSGFFTRLNDGRYLLTSGFTDCRVFELKGIDSMRRLKGGRMALGDKAIARAREIREFRQRGGNVRGSMSVVENDTITIDGALSEWNRDCTAGIKVDDQRGAEIVSAADADNLYVAWDVRDDTPMKNSVDKWQIAFKGGDAVDLMFRAAGKNLDHAKVRAGDLRLLITRIDGNLQAVLYRQVSEHKEPFLFDAFEGANRANAVRMDEVRLAPEVKTVLKKNKSGYIIEAAIPWNLLGAKPAAGSEFRLDFGVLFGDSAGGKTVVRAYWENQDANIVVDIPSEATLQPAKWGRAVMAK